MRARTVSASAATRRTNVRKAATVRAAPLRAPA
eukprot:CAMPEP_0183798956 /NCGR_PEP_ID=MMETSP0803_2-20130417/20270_1 /TAXON_ID=195967 /ORGANISM="Crustomastix stigmata, Strain CCMP3273" /LENGTH=32 /DNA_ID= /DNA_START= /DNA_END= /DNA_ORIENTATION=